MRVFYVILFFIYSSTGIAKSMHQIGSVWGKHPLRTAPETLVTDPFLKSNPLAKKIAEATAWLTHPVHNGLGNYLGSAHLLGVFDGQFVMLTNSHLVHEKFCNGVTLEFVFLEGKPKVICEKVFYRNETLDLALMLVSPQLKDRDLLRSKGINLSYDEPLVLGRQLFTIGFSRHNGIRGLKPGERPRSPEVAYLTRDADCRILSTQTKLIRNPKRETEVFKPTHSYAFPTGCDAFDAGDCGALYVDETANRIVGLYWTEGFHSGDVVEDGQAYVQHDQKGLIKSEEPGAATLDVISDQIVKDALSGQLGARELWSKLTYVIPAAEIKRSLLREPLAREVDYACLFQEMLETRITECERSRRTRSPQPK